MYTMPLHPTLRGYTIMLRHCLQLFLLLTFSSFVQPLFILDITNGRQFAPPVPKDNFRYRNVRANWEPSFFWWRSKRSVPEPLSNPFHTDSLLPPLVSYQNPLASSSSSDNDNSLLKSPPYNSNKDSRRRTVYKHFLKMKQVAAIKKALRRRDKLRRLRNNAEQGSRLERQLSKLRALQMDDLSPKRVSELRRHPHPMKSRRAKMVEVTRRLTNPTFSLPSKPIGYQVFPGKSSTTRNGAHSDLFGPGNFGEPFTTHVEMFPTHQVSSPMGSFSSEPGMPGFGRAPVSFSQNSGSFNPYRASTSFQSRPLQSSERFGQPVLFPGDVGPNKAIGTFSGPGAFVDNSKDCPTISTKSCSSDLDCSCHGFYTCVRGRCDIVQTMMQAQQPGSQSGTWHDQPVEFDISKRSSDTGDSQRLDAESPQD